MNIVKTSRVAAGVLAAAAFAVTANATNMGFSVTGFAGSQPVNATATVITSANQITVTLNNLQANPLEVLSLISGFGFTLGGGGNPNASTSLTSLSQNTVSVVGNLAANVSTGTALTGALWTLEDGSGPSIFLNSLGSTGPSGLVIGPSGPGGAYTAANNSITGAPHNPFFQSGVTFTLLATGVTAATTISDGYFRFGTTGTPPSTGVPDGGATVALLGLGLAALALVRRKMTS